jgi:hypothetical protein
MDKKTKVIKIAKKSKTKVIKPNKKTTTKVIKPNKKSKTKVMIGGDIIDKKRLIKDSKSKFLIFHSEEYTEVANLFKEKLELAHIEKFESSYKKKKELEKKHKTIKVDFEDTNIYKTIMNNYEEGPLKGLLKGLLHKKRIVIMFKKDRDNNEYGAKEYFRAVTKLLTDIGKKLKDKKIFVFFPFKCREDQGYLGESNQFYTKFGATALESITSMNYYHKRLHLMRDMFLDINRRNNLKNIYFFNLDRLEVVKNREADNIFQNTGHTKCQLNDKSKQRFNGVFDLIINREFRPEYSPHDPDCSKTFKIDITSENNYLGEPIEVQEANRWEMGLKCKKTHGDPIDSFGNFREKDRETSQSDDSSNLQQKNILGTENMTYAQAVNGNTVPQNQPPAVTVPQMASVPNMQLSNEGYQPGQHLRMQPNAVDMQNKMIEVPPNQFVGNVGNAPKQPQLVNQQVSPHLVNMMTYAQKVKGITESPDQFYTGHVPNNIQGRGGAGAAKKKQEYKKYKIKEVLGKNKQIFKEKDKKSKKEYIKHKKEYILVKDYIKLMKK